MAEDAMQLKDKVYRDYHEKVLHYVIGKTSNYDEAEDITQNIFIKIFAKLDTFDEQKASISTWVYTIAQNTVIDYYRTRKVHSEISEEVPIDGEIDADILNEEMLETLADALEKLDERSRDLIIMHYYKGMNLKEAAIQLGMSYSNVKLVHNKALAVMRNYLGDLVYD